MCPRLRELAPVARGSPDAGSRNLGPTFFNIPVCGERDLKDLGGGPEPDRDVHGKVFGGAGRGDAEAQRLAGLDLGGVIVNAELVRGYI